MSATSRPRDQAVQSMFDRIAGRYDLVNRIISFRLDAFWRQRAIRSVLASENPWIVDLGTGTGDLAFNAAKLAGDHANIVGLDLSMHMLRLAQRKSSLARRRCNTTFIQASAMQAPLKGGVFDGAMTAFVLRNVSDLPSFFAEGYRLLKPRGKFVSLDMFPPPNGWFRHLYSVYFFHLMPLVAGILARDRKAYRYLSDSVRQFYSPEAVAQLIKHAGFVDVKIRKFLCGAVCMHVASKPSPTL